MYKKAKYIKISLLCFSYFKLFICPPDIKKGLQGLCPLNPHQGSTMDALQSPAAPLDLHLHFQIILWLLYPKYNIWKLSLLSKTDLHKGCPPWCHLLLNISTSPPSLSQDPLLDKKYHVSRPPYPFSTFSQLKISQNMSLKLWRYYITFGNILKYTHSWNPPPFIKVWKPPSFIKEEGVWVFEIFKKGGGFRFFS